MDLYQVVWLNILIPIFLIYGRVEIRQSIWKEGDTIASSVALLHS
jgi:hypothetical protein